jgi:uncharacterized SAM-binding protein YcdF (DUF218 family)
MSPRLRRWTIALVVPLVLLTSLYLARGRILPWGAWWLDVGGNPEPADYVMVLGAGIDERPFAAAALFKAGLAKHVLVSHVRFAASQLDGSMPPDDVIVRRVLVARGVPDDAISVIGSWNASTYDEARALGKLLETRPEAKVLILTNDFHTRRTRWIFREILGSHSSQIAIISTPSEGFRLDRWWRSDLGFLTIAGENLKFLLYVVYYGRTFRVAAPIVLLAIFVALYYYRRHRAGGRLLSGSERGVRGL